MPNLDDNRLNQLVEENQIIVEIVNACTSKGESVYPKVENNYDSVDKIKEYFKSSQFDYIDRIVSQQKMLDDIADRAIPGKNGVIYTNKDGIFGGMLVSHDLKESDRVLYTCFAELSIDNNKEVIKKNQELASLIAEHKEGYIELVRRAVRSIINLDPKELFNTDIEKAAKYAAEHLRELNLCRHIWTFSSALKNNNSPEDRELIEHLNFAENFYGNRYPVLIDYYKMLSVPELALLDNMRRQVNIGSADFIRELGMNTDGDAFSKFQALSDTITKQFKANHLKLENSPTPIINGMQKVFKSFGNSNADLRPIAFTPKKVNDKNTFDNYMITVLDLPENAGFSLDNPPENEYITRNDNKKIYGILYPENTKLINKHIETLTEFQKLFDGQNPPIAAQDDMYHLRTALTNAINTLDNIREPESQQVQAAISQTIEGLKELAFKVYNTTLSEPQLTDRQSMLAFHLREFNVYINDPSMSSSNGITAQTENQKLLYERLSAQYSQKYDMIAKPTDFNSLVQSGRDWENNDISRDLFDDITAEEQEAFIKNGSTLYAAHSNYRNTIDKIKSTVVDFKNRITATKELFTDSPEFRELRTAVNSLAEKLDTPNMKLSDYNKELDKLSKAADDYYFAKLDQKHNFRRGQRFEIAMEIKDFAEKSKAKDGNLPSYQPNKEYMLREAIAARIVKSYIKSDDPAVVTKGTRALRSRDAFNKEVQDVMNDLAFNHIVLNKNEQELKSFFAGNSVELVKNYRERVANQEELIKRDNRERGEKPKDNNEVKEVKKENKPENKKNNTNVKQKNSNSNQRMTDINQNKSSGSKVNGNENRPRSNSMSFGGK